MIQVVHYLLIKHTCVSCKPVCVGWVHAAATIAEVVQNKKQRRSRFIARREGGN